MEHLLCPTYSLTWNFCIIKTIPIIVHCRGLGNNRSEFVGLVNLGHSFCGGELLDGSTYLVSSYLPLSM